MTPGLAALAERLAGETAARHGATVLGRNVRVGRGELDLVIHHRSVKVAVEVKCSSIGLDDAEAHFDDAKRDQVAFLASELGCHRVDLVAVTADQRGWWLRWLPDVG